MCANTGFHADQARRHIGASAPDVGKTTQIRMAVTASTGSASEESTKSVAPNPRSMDRENPESTKCGLFVGFKSMTKLSGGQSTALL
jgi:hypothetical protein